MGIKILTLETSCYWPSLKRLETIIFSWTTVLIVIFERSLNEKAPLRKFMHKFFIFFIRVHGPALKIIFIVQRLVDLPRVPGQSNDSWAGRYPILFPLVSYQRPDNLDFLNCNEPDGQSIVQKFQTSFFSKYQPLPRNLAKNLQKNNNRIGSVFLSMIQSKKKELV